MLRSEQHQSSVQLPHRSSGSQCHLDGLHGIGRGVALDPAWRVIAHERPRRAGRAHVRADEAGDHRAAVEVDDARARAGALPHRDGLVDRDDAHPRIASASRPWISKLSVKIFPWTRTVSAGHAKAAPQIRKAQTALNALASLLTRPLHAFAESYAQPGRSEAALAAEAWQELPDKPRKESCRMTMAGDAS